MNARSRNRCRAHEIVLEFATPVVNFLPINGDSRWGGDAEPDFVSLDRHDFDADVAVDHDFLADSPCENQHEHSSVCCLDPLATDPTSSERPAIRRRGNEKSSA